MAHIEEDDDQATERMAGYYIIDHENDDRVIRGPYERRETAFRAREEMERGYPWDTRGILWVVEEPEFSDGRDD